jgi:hypothetical protein
VADLTLTDRLLAVLMEQPTPTTNEEAEALAAMLAGVALAALAGEPITPETVGHDPHGSYIRIFELVCRGPRHEARPLARALGGELRDAILDRLQTTAHLVREEGRYADEVNPWRSNQEATDDV